MHYRQCINVRVYVAQKISCTDPPTLMHNIRHGQAIQLKELQDSPNFGDDGIHSYNGRVQGDIACIYAPHNGTSNTVPHNGTQADLACCQCCSSYLHYRLYINVRVYATLRKDMCRPTHPYAQHSAGRGHN